MATRNNARESVFDEHCSVARALLALPLRSRGVARISTKRHNNLPAHRIRLIGREQDLRDAGEALLGTEGRLLTLTGTGGCGKTRLALELASLVSPRFANGVALVELAAIVEAGLV